MATDDKNWKLKLRYGKITTPYKHYCILADGLVHDLVGEFECPKGSAWMAMNGWALDADQAADMICSIGKRIGFEVTGRIEIYDSDPTQPPKENPYGYEISFSPYDE